MDLKRGPVGCNLRWCSVVLLIMIFSAASLGQAPAPPPVPPPGSPGTVQPVGFRNDVPPAPNYGRPATPTPAAPPAADPVDYPLSLCAEAARTLQAVRDYSCVFIKQ